MKPKMDLEMTKEMTEDFFREYLAKNGLYLRPGAEVINQLSELFCETVEILAERARSNDDTIENRKTEAIIDQKRRERARLARQEKEIEEMRKQKAILMKKVEEKRKREREEAEMRRLEESKYYFTEVPQDMVH